MTEYSIGYMNSYTAMVTAHQLLSGDKMAPEQLKSISECHIYIITARPSPYFKPDSLKHENDLLSGKVCYRIDGVEKEIDFSGFGWELVDGAVSIDCKYPFKEIISRNPEGNEVRYIAASYLANIYLSEGSEHLTDLNNYEVLYVGQSIGNTGNRNALDRLTNHSTLQKILAQVGYDYPDKEIMIFMHEFKHEYMFSSTDGRAKDSDTSDANETRLFNAIENPPNKRQKIGMVEAGLIRYFQPHYNEIYKIKFPSTKLKVLNSCYELDISGLTIELNSTDLNYFLHSATVRTDNHHIAQFDLFDALERNSFFTPTGMTINPKVIK